MVDVNEKELVCFYEKKMSFNNFIENIFFDAKKSNTYSKPLKFPMESEENCVEYKLQIIPKNETRIKQLTSQMMRRINTGRGHCVYYIGICDNGDINGISKNKMTTSLKYIMFIINKQKYDLINIQVFSVAKLLKKQRYWCVLNIMDNNYDNEKNEFCNLFE
jgi:GTPase